jgi:hypothetical protein
VLVTRDDEGFPASLLGVATAMDPGPHRFTTRAPDGPLVEQQIDVAPGERKELVLDVRTADSAAPSDTPPPDGETPPDDGETPPPDTQGRHPSPWVYVAGGVGVAGFLTAGVAGGLLLSKRAVVIDNCDSGQRNPDGSIPCTQAGKDAADVAQHTLAPITEVGLAVGAAGAIGTILLLVLDKPKPAQTGWSGVRTDVAISKEGAFLGVHSSW